MALDIQIKPVGKWPGEQRKNPKNAPFRKGYKDTLKDLQFELSKIRAISSSLVLEMFVDPREIRKDGQLRADARVQKHGVIFRFSRYTGKRKPDGTAVTQDVSYPCDAFTHWQDNLRAIVLSMEHLRHVERYGVFKYDDIIERLALPTAEGKVSTRETAAAFMAIHSGQNRDEIAAMDSVRQAAYRAAAKKLHPDNKETGSVEDFQKLNEANLVLTTGY